MFVIHQIENCRGQIANLTASLNSKKEYQKRIAAKLAAYKEIVAIVDKVGGGDEQLTEIFKQQERETVKLEDELKNNPSSKMQTSMYAFDEDDF